MNKDVKALIDNMCAQGFNILKIELKQKDAKQGSIIYYRVEFQAPDTKSEASQNSSFQERPRR